MSEVILPEQAERSLKNLAMAMYIMLGVSLFTALPTGLLAVIIAHIKRDDARGTWLHAHYSYFIETFWVSIAAIFIGGVLCATIIGIPLGFLLFGVTWLWGLYRTVKGGLRLNEGRNPYTEGKKYL